MASNPAISLASTIQSASINRAPSPRHDINPSTAASTKKPVTLDSDADEHAQATTPIATTSEAAGAAGTSPSASIPEYVVHEVPRRSTLPPLPDLRFEQSYLKSIAGRDAWGVAWVTARDQVLLPLVQGLAWTLILQGWRVWNRGAKFRGTGVGAKIRRWWWGVNDWKIPDPKAKAHNLAKEAGDFFGR